MRKLAERLLQLYVLTIPWDVVAIPGLGTLARISGMAVIGVTALTILAEGRFRRPGAVFTMTLAFIGAAVLSLLWTISFEATLQPVITYAQLLASVWVIQEVARTGEQRQRLFVAFCVGLFVPLLSLLAHFVAGSGTANRMLAGGFTTEGVALVLVTGIPFACYLAITATGFSRLLGFVYVPLALIGVPLTGARTAFMAAVVAMAVVPLVAQLSRRMIVLMAAVIIAVPIAASQVVPQQSWDRISTIPGELLQGGNMSNRRMIWRAGLGVFPEHPVVGTGAGTYGTAIAPLRQTIYNTSIVAHNVFIGILIEQGVLGLGLFIAILAACMVSIARMPPNERKLWAVVLTCWVIGALSISLERWKVTWMLVGMMAAHRATATVRRTQPVAAPAVFVSRPEGAPALHATIRTVREPVARRW